MGVLAVLVVAMGFIPAEARAEGPPPREAEIARVVADGRDGLAACYQRALASNPSLVNSRLTVALSIAASGRVTSVKVDGPAETRPLRPCLEETIARWSFPAAPEAYGAALPLVLQGVQ